MAKQKKKGLAGNKTILLAIALVAVVLFVLIFTAFNKLFATETYYVLNTNVPAKQMITPEMLSPVDTSEGTSPRGALGISEAQTGNLYTKFPLNADDILTNSNVTNRLADIATGIPDDWVVTNFAVSADNASQGRIQRGIYFDMMVLGKNAENETIAFYPFVNLLALDTNSGVENASSANAINNPEESQNGQTEQYVVGMSPQNAAKLHTIIETYRSNNIRLVMSPMQNEYNPPKVSEYQGLLRYDPNADGTIWAGKGDDDDPREVTDNTFSAVTRDENNKPIEKALNCGVGNMKNVEECSEEKAKKAIADSKASLNGTEGVEGGNGSPTPIENQQ